MYYVQPGCENKEDCHFGEVCVRDSDSDPHGMCKVSISKVSTRWRTGMKLKYCQCLLCILSSLGVKTTMTVTII